MNPLLFLIIIYHFNLADPMQDYHQQDLLLQDPANVVQAISIC